MKTIQARFKSKCAECGGPIESGDTIIYDPDTKNVWHNEPDCAPEEPEEKPDPRSEDLASKLGYE